MILSSILMGVFFLLKTTSFPNSVCLLCAHSELFPQLYALDYDTRIALLDDHGNRTQFQIRFARRPYSSKTD